MAINTSIFSSIVPITQFNKGQSSKIFDRVKKERQLIVMKNNEPSAIILSVEEYTAMAEAKEDLYLLRLAEEQAEAYGGWDNMLKNAIPSSEVKKELGITAGDIATAEELDFE